MTRQTADVTEICKPLLAPARAPAPTLTLTIGHQIVVVVDGK